MGTASTDHNHNMGVIDELLTAAGNFEDVSSLGEGSMLVACVGPQSTIFSRKSYGYTGIAGSVGPTSTGMTTITPRRVMPIRRATR